MGEAPQILVTGATGFIGTHLVGKLAEEGRPARCLVRGSSLKVARDHLSRFGAELLYADHLTDSGSLGAATEGVTTVFYLGGGWTVQMTSMDDYLRINVDATPEPPGRGVRRSKAPPRQARPPTASHRLSRHPRGGGGRGAFAPFSPRPWRSRA